MGHYIREDRRYHNFVLVFGTVVIIALYIIQARGVSMITAWKGVISQAMVMVTVYMVVRVPKRGTKVGVVLNGLICLATSVQVFRFSMISALPGVIIPIGTIVIVLIIAHYNRLIIQKTQELNEEKTKRMRDIVEMQDVSIMAMSALASTRDSETGKHVQRTKLYVKVLAEKLYEKGTYGEELTQQMVDMIVASAPLHDIGKVGIPDSILLKPAKLTPEEFDIIKTHTLLGYEALTTSRELMGANDDFLKYAGDMVLYHHEKWDGSGYMDGLKGDDIPLPARIMAVADVYDALTDKRVYKERFTHTKALSIISDEAGKHFDPRIVDTLFECQHIFAQIAEDYREHYDA